MVSALLGVPLYLALVNVFKTNEQILSAPAALPAPVTLDNVITVLSGNGPDFGGRCSTASSSWSRHLPEPSCSVQ